MPFEIKYASDLLTPFVHLFLLGDTGSGKTSTLGSFPHPLIICPKNEQSIMALRGAQIQYVEVATPDETDEVLSWLESQYRKALTYAQAGDGASAWETFPYQTIGFESLSHYGDLIIEALIEGGNGKSAGKMDQQKWGALGAHLRNLHSRIRNLPVHAVFTSLATIKESQHSGNEVGGPLMSGAMAYKLPSACDAIGYCEVVPGPRPIYRTHFQRYKLFPARMRTPRGAPSPAYIDNLTWDSLKGYFGH